MAKDSATSKENFDALLAWLDHNREAAGQKYEKIRQRLIRLFVCRGCFEAEELADQTINRVMLKIPQISESYTGEPTLYFYGVGDKIHLEWLRRQKKIQHLELTETDNYVEPEPEPESEYECLESCLESLQTSERELIVAYYKEEKRAKIELRRLLAKNLGISIGALQVKACRIRASLQKCVQNCLKEKIS
jgi:DNA-directed RNA polymerase specialized sigma24 family protein